VNWKSALYTVGAVTLLTVVGTSGHIPGAPATSSQPEGCQVSGVASERISARQFCIELKARGCGNPQRDCDRIPADQTYYYRH
jgi:hypothetical protein